MVFFENCTNLSAVSIPNSITYIGDMAFQGCENLTSVIIPNTINTIEYDAFAECIRLNYVTIGNSVTTIEHNAFERCYSLDTVICLAQEPPILGLDESYDDHDCFPFTPIDKTLIVPCGTIASYTASVWNTFFMDILEPISETTIEATINAGADYTENGFSITNVQESGTFTQTLTTTDGCDSVIVLNLTVTSGLEEANGKSERTAVLYPNPAEYFVSLRLDNLTTDAELVIFDVQGKTIIRKELAAGTYSVRLISSNGVITRKLIRL